VVAPRGAEVARGGVEPGRGDPGRSSGERRRHHDGWRWPGVNGRRAEATQGQRRRQFRARRKLEAWATVGRGVEGVGMIFDIRRESHYTFIS
jgi:hypothetical protein